MVGEGVGDGVTSAGEGVADGVTSVGEGVGVSVCKGETPGLVVEVSVGLNVSAGCRDGEVSGAVFSGAEVPNGGVLLVFVEVATRPAQAETSKRTAISAIAISANLFLFTNITSMNNYYVCRSAP
jgi:hypothetical protein